MAKFHPLTVSDVRTETADCVSIAFEVPANLSAEYAYKQGQYLTIKLNVNGEEIRRSYSLCSSPVTDNELRIAIKRVKDGRGSNWLNTHVKKGDVLEVMTPMGNFYSELSADNQKHYVLFAGGSGVTPILSILKSVLKAEPKSSVTFFYGNLDEASTIFANEIEAIEKANGERLKVYHILDNPTTKSADELLLGIMSPEKVKKLMDAFVKHTPQHEYFICGPTGMMDSVRDTLQHLNIPKNLVHVEYFTSQLEAAKTTSTSTMGNTPILESMVTVIMDGDETTLTLNSKGESILDAALNAGVDVPFACKGAVCCTCRAKVVEGKVQMDLNYALSEEEVAQGYVLTCQAHPLTPVVIVDFDAN